MKFRSSGKLLITGEYLVLEGAKALALPTKFGQEMNVSYQQSETSPSLTWTAYNSDNNIWFDAKLELPSLKIISSSNEESSNDLIKLLHICFKENSSLFKSNNDIVISTHLEFPNDWGLGSSSTLISNLSKWSEVDAFKLLKSISKGSGFDVAVGLENKAIIYELNNGIPTWEVINFNPVFKENIYFIHLNKKQKSEIEIENFKLNPETELENIDQINFLTNSLINSIQLSDFKINIRIHERLISNELNIPTVQTRLFDDYKNGAIKSLGAWGGDFILVTVQDKTNLNYFRDKGYNTILSYSEMISE